MEGSLDPRVTVGAVTLSVADLERSLDYYRHNIGLTLQEREGDTAVLGAGARPIVKLREQPGARVVRRVTGLYHYAILLPSRLELARTLRHLAETDTPLSGASDHLVSEALYLYDPDGHGIEIYRDRPRSDWYDEHGNLVGDTLPLDMDGLIGELAGDDAPWTGINPAARMGHVHLHVANLAEADRFYVDTIGFGKPVSFGNIPTASFVSAGGYHHHLGLNTWAGAGAPPAPADAARLLSYEILFPHAAALAPVLARLEAAGVAVAEQEGGRLVKDPSLNSILLRTAG
jgi:catechol 2,3-dioxygenase